MFRVYDYTNATRLFGKDFITKTSPGTGLGHPPPPPDVVISVDGFDVTVTPAGKSILASVDGNPTNML